MTLFTFKVASVPGTPTAQSELADALRTFRYHYLCKVYLPMYRALHWDPAAEDQHRQPLVTVGSWRQEDDQGRTPAGVSNRNRACSRLIERSTFHRELLLLRSRRAGHEKRCWSLEQGDAERWRQNRNKKNSSGALSKSDRNLSTVAAAAEKHRPFRSVNICEQQQQLTRSHLLATASFAASSSEPTTLNFYGASSSSCRGSVSGSDCSRNGDDHQLSYSNDKGTSDCDRKNFESRQMALQQEAQLALAMAQTMARMQLEVEKQTKKRNRTSSPPSFAITLEINANRRNLGDSNEIINRLKRMNLAEVQLVANDLLSQIEELNEELMRLLLERDELHMEQDSVLVDIDDLTRRAQETTMALKFNQMPQGGTAVSTAS